MKTSYKISVAIVGGLLAAILSTLGLKLQFYFLSTRNLGLSNATAGVFVIAFLSYLTLGLLLSIIVIKLKSFSYAIFFIFIFSLVSTITTVFDIIDYRSNYFNANIYYTIVFYFCTNLILYFLTGIFVQKLTTKLSEIS